MRFLIDNESLPNARRLAIALMAIRLCTRSEAEDPLADDLARSHKPGRFC
jgi:hypothetical protein